MRHEGVNLLNNNVKVLWSISTIFSGKSESPVCLLCHRGHINDILEGGKLYRLWAEEPEPDVPPVKNRQRGRPKKSATQPEEEKQGLGKGLGAGGEQETTGGGEQDPSDSLKIVRAIVDDLIIKLPQKSNQNFGANLQNDDSGKQEQPSIVNGVLPTTSAATDEPSPDADRECATHQQSGELKLPTENLQNGNFLVFKGHHSSARL